MKNIFIIFGTSGAGKTTIYRTLKEKHPDLGVHDIDEDGVPKNPSHEWRLRRTDELLEKAINYQKNDMTTVLCGVIVPSEIRESKYFSENLKIHYIFLKLDQEIIQKRLEERKFPKEEIENNLNWARHLENLAINEPNHTIINTTEKDKETVLKEVLKIIKK